MGCRVSNSGVQNYIDFIEKNNVSKGILVLLKTDLVWGLQKLGIILENKVLLFQKTFLIVAIYNFFMAKIDL